MADQLQLFENKGKAAEMIVEIRGLCTVCGLEIRNIEYPDQRLVLSDYADAEGRCFYCSTKARKGSLGFVICV